MTQDTLAPDGTSGPQKAAKALLALSLTLLGVWTLHRYLPALIWAPILAIAVWPMYQRAVHRFPPGRHNILLPSIFTLALGLMFIVPLVLVGVQAGKEVRGVYETIDKARTDGIPPPELFCPESDVMSAPRIDVLEAGSAAPTLATNSTAASPAVRPAIT